MCLSCPLLHIMERTEEEAAPTTITTTTTHMYIYIYNINFYIYWYMTYVYCAPKQVQQTEGRNWSSSVETKLPNLAMAFHGFDVALARPILNRIYSFLKLRLASCRGIWVPSHSSPHPLAHVTKPRLKSRQATLSDLQQQQKQKNYKISET